MTDSPYAATSLKEIPDWVQVMLDSSILVVELGAAPGTYTLLFCTECIAYIIIVLFVQYNIWRENIDIARGRARTSFSSLSTQVFPTCIISL